MRLALKMGKTVQELYEQMSAYEFSLWAALYAVDPWGEERADYRAGLTISQLVNISGKYIPRGKEVKPSDFMPFQKKPEQDQEFVDMDPATFLKSLGHG